MDRIIKIVCLLCFFALNNVYAQNDENNHDKDGMRCDTIVFKGYSLIINVPSFSYTHKSFYQYEEGIFITYPYKDSAYLFIHYGYNVTRPFCDSTQVESISENDTLKSYFGINNGVFFKEIYYKKRKISISYVNIRGEDVPLFDSIIQSLRFLPVKVNHFSDDDTDVW